MIDEAPVKADGSAATDSGCRAVTAVYKNLKASWLIWTVQPWLHERDFVRNSKQLFGRQEKEVLFLFGINFKHCQGSSDMVDTGKGRRVSGI